MSYESRHSLKNGDVVLYTRNGSATYHARLKLPGVSGYVVKSTRCEDLTEAVRTAEDLYDDLKYRARHGLEVRSHTFESLYRRWVAATQDQLSVHRFLDGTAQRYLLPFFGKMQVEGIKDTHITDYWVWRRDYWNSADGQEKIERAQRSRTTGKWPFKQKLGTVARSPSQKTLDMEASTMRQIFN